MPSGLMPSAEACVGLWERWGLRFCSGNAYALIDARWGGLGCTDVIRRTEAITSKCNGGSSVMKGTFHSLVLVPLLLVATACNASPVSGTYVAHAPTFAEMLQLTQTPDGQISGVISHIDLKSDGKISSEQSPVNGTADSGQLTLKFPTVLSFIPGKSLAGTISGGVIHLQNVDSSGNVSSETFERSDPSKFKTYADELKS